MECRNADPEVIDHILIQSCLEEQGFKGEAGRLARLEGIPWEDVKEIRIEFKRILRIDHIWVLPALTKLSLSNNYIESIENLDALVNLVELNLSFNKISVLQNMDNLKNLEVLLLYQNIIERIENVNGLKNLTIFNLGMNLITDPEELLSLRHHKKLKCLNMTGNPCAEGDGLRIYIAVFVPHVQFFAYKRISDDERILGVEKYKGSLIRIIQAEAIARAEEVKREEEQIEAELHAESFVEFFNTNHLFNQMFEQDSEGRDFLSMGMDAMECYEEFREKLLEISMQIFEKGQHQFNLRTQEVQTYWKCVNDAKSANQKESIVEMELFTKRHNDIIATIIQMQEDIINREIHMEDYLLKIYDFQLEIDKRIIPAVWKKLMRLEITLFEQLEEVNRIFEETLTDMIGNFIEIARGGFTQMRMLATTYISNIGELAFRYMNNSIAIASFITDKDMAPYVTDRDTLNSALSGSHDVHMQIIDIREDRLIHRAKAWLENLVQNLFTITP